MRSSVSLILLALAAPGFAGERSGRPGFGASAPAAAAPAPAPFAVSLAEPRPPEADAAQPYDGVGRASTRSDGGVAGAHRVLPPGTVAEVTALETGRTILVLIDRPLDGVAGDEISLTPAAAAELGIAGGGAAVRVRAAVPTPADRAALAAGRPAALRMDAPPALLAGLRRRLAEPAALVASKPVPPRSRAKPTVASTAATSGTAPAPAASPRPAALKPATPAGRFRVQVAAVSSETRAREAARALGGSVEQAGAMWRVRLGPFADVAAARRARDGAVRRGYAGAQILP